MFALVAWASNNRPVLIALAIVFLCGWLLRPKAPRTGQDVAAPVAARAAVATPKKRAVSISTAGILLRLGGGAPEIDDSALTALLALCAIADIHLVTQLETDSDAQARMESLAPPSAQPARGVQGRVAPSFHLSTAPFPLPQRQEAAVMAAFETAGVFGEGACDRRKASAVPEPQVPPQLCACPYHQYRRSSAPGPCP